MQSRSGSGRGFAAWTSEIDARSLRADALAGLLGAVLVLPQGIAFATLAGLPPQYGLYTAIVPCAIAALFGSSRHVVSGPTNANSLALFAMCAPLAAVGSPEYVGIALALTFLVGLIQCGVGLLRLGAAANFISPAALMGFTSGAALLIALHALRDLFALPGPAAHGTLDLLGHLVRDAASISPASLATGAVTAGVALALRAWRRTSPFMLGGLVAGTAAAAAFNAWGEAAGWAPVRTVGLVPAAWPPLSMPALDPERLRELAGPALALSIVALGQSISIAKAVALRSGQRIDANREFVGQGLSNLVGPFFSSYVSCGSLNRSLPNFEAGARTPLAAVFSAVLLVALLAASGPWLAWIPMPAISALLLLVAWSLLDPPRWRKVLRASRTEYGVALLTLVATLTLRLEIAILLGTIASLLAYLVETSRPAMRAMGFSASDPQRRFVVLADTDDALPECPQLKLLRMEGSVYFGAAQHVSDRLHALREGPDPPRHLLVMAKSMNSVDLAGVEVWEAERAARRALGGDLHFHRPRPQVLQMWKRTGFLDALGRDHLHPDKRTALARIVPTLDPDRCAVCTARVFEECASRPGGAAREPAGA